VNEQIFNWLSENTDQANAVAAIANTIIAALALVVAVASIVFAAKGLRTQRQHNKLSVRPLPFIACADYEDHLRVKVRNDGTGPLIVRSVDALLEGVKQHDELVSYMPELPPGLSWCNFSSGVVRSIPAGGELILLELKLDLTKQHHTHFRDLCRGVLQKITIVVNYSDVYEDNFDPVTRDLNWFGRRLASSRSVGQE